jgi:hypothetical protein
MDPKAAIVLKGLGHQFATGGTDALETPALWEVPEIKLAGGLDALRALGKPTDVMRDAKGRLFGALLHIYRRSRRRTLLAPERLAEQRRIAARLKAQLAEVDRARQAAQAQLREVACSTRLLQALSSLDAPNNAWRIRMIQTGQELPDRRSVWRSRRTWRAWSRCTLLGERADQGKPWAKYAPA